MLGLVVAPWCQRLFSAAAAPSPFPGRLQAAPGPVSELALGPLTQRGSLVTVAPEQWCRAPSMSCRSAARLWSSVSSVFGPFEPSGDLSFCDGTDLSDLCVIWTLGSHQIHSSQYSFSKLSLHFLDGLLKLPSL